MRGTVAGTMTAKDSKKNPTEIEQFRPQPWDVVGAEKFL